MSDIETETGTRYQHRYVFDGVNNAGEWSITSWPNFDTCQRYAMEGLEDFARHGLKPAIQYRIARWTKTTEWAPYDPEEAQ